MKKCFDLYACYTIYCTLHLKSIKGKHSELILIYTKNNVWAKVSLKFLFYNLMTNPDSTACIGAAFGAPGSILGHIHVIL